MKDVYQDTCYTFFQHIHQPISFDQEFTINDDEHVLLEPQEETKIDVMFDEEDDEEIEKEYRISRGLIYGDSNFPVIDTGMNGDSAGALERLRAQKRIENSERLLAGSSVDVFEVNS